MINKKPVLTIALGVLAATSVSSAVEAGTIEKVRAKKQQPSIGNKQTQLWKDFHDNIEKQERWERDRPYREAQEAARVDTGLVGDWIFSTTNRDGDRLQVMSWIRSDGTMLFYLVPDPSKPAPIGGHVIKPFARSTWGYENGILTENSNNGTTNYQVDRVSRDELVLKVISSTAGVNSGTQYTYRKRQGIGANIPK